MSPRALRDVAVAFSVTGARCVDRIVVVTRGVLDHCVQVPVVSHSGTAAGQFSPVHVVSGTGQLSPVHVVSGTGQFSPVHVVSGTGQFSPVHATCPLTGQFSPTQASVVPPTGDTTGAAFVVLVGVFSYSPCPVGTGAGLLPLPVLGGFCGLGQFGPVHGPGLPFVLAFFADHGVFFLSQSPLATRARSHFRSEKPDEARLPSHIAGADASLTLIVWGRAGKEISTVRRSA